MNEQKARYRSLLIIGAELLLVCVLSAVMVPILLNDKNLFVSMENAGLLYILTGALAIYGTLLLISVFWRIAYHFLAAVHVAPVALIVIADLILSRFHFNYFLAGVIGLLLIVLLPHVLYYRARIRIRKFEKIQTDFLCVL
jgi:di/tricarboxylate transporter